MECVVPLEYKWQPTPPTPASAKTWIALHETMVKTLPDKTPFGEVIAAIRAALRGPQGEPPEVEIYLEPISLEEYELTMTTPILSPFVGQVEVSVHTYLTYILRPFSLIHYAHDRLVIVTSPCDDCPGEPTATANEAWTWRLLHEVVPLKFPDGVALVDLLETIQRGTVGKGKNGHGLVIYVDPLGLKEVGKQLSSSVSIDLENSPLCTALGLALKTIDLAFRVRGDGIIEVTSRGGERLGPMDVTETMYHYQLERYWGFHEAQDAEAAERELERKERAKPQGKDEPEKASGTGDGFRSPRPRKHRAADEHRRVRRTQR
jgi:hypothetical protein